MRALARAASLIESGSELGREVVSALFPYTGEAMVLGITGPPGVGKSTLVDQLAKVLRAEDKTVGIVAVDPSSPFTHGAILGDRIRMADHHLDPGVFIRSMASRGNMGGLARSTFEMVLLFDAAGKDVVMVETVGVGQDEVEIAAVADVTLVVLVPGLGDDVQAVKAGIMEIADLFVINKADLPGAERLEQDIRTMQGFGDDKQRAGAAPVRRVVARDGSGVAELLSTARDVFAKLEKRQTRTTGWALRLREMVREQLMAAVPDAALAEHARLVAEKAEDPYSARDALIAEVRSR